MRKVLPAAVFVALAFIMTSCEKTYTCECSVPAKAEKELLQVSAWNKGRAEVKCISKNTAGPTTSGYYNCSLTATD